MKNAIRALREQRNRELQEARSESQRIRIRMERQMEEMRAQTLIQIQEAVSRATEESNRRMEEQKRERERQLEEIQRNVSSRIRDLREQQNRTIREMERHVQDSMNRMHEQIESNAKNIEVAIQGINRLSEHVGEMEQRIEGQFAQHQQQIDSIQDQLIAIEERGEERAKIAVEWMDAVEKSNHLERFVPDETSEVRRRLRNLQQLQASGAKGAELAAAANEVIIAAQELEIKCNRERLKYEQKEEMTRTMLETVLEIVNMNREIELSDDDGNPVKVENNFWSRGRYNELHDRLEAMQQEIAEHGNTDMTIERLDEMQNEITQGEVEIKEITAQSVERVMLSEARMRIVEDIIGVMEQQHWQVISPTGKEEDEEIGYKGGIEDSDMREGFFVRLKNNMGEEVTVMVDPDEKQQRNTIGFHFSGGNATDQDKERNSAAVADQLRQSGYTLGVPQCASHNPIPEMESFEEMTRQGASERIREKE